MEQDFFTGKFFVSSVLSVVAYNLTSYMLPNL